MHGSPHPPAAEARVHPRLACAGAGLNPDAKANVAVKRGSRDLAGWQRVCLHNGWRVLSSQHCDARRRRGGDTPLLAGCKPSPLWLAGSGHGHEGGVQRGLSGRQAVVHIGQLQGMGGWVGRGGRGRELNRGTHARVLRRAPAAAAIETPAHAPPDHTPHLPHLNSCDLQRGLDAAARLLSSARHRMDGQMIAGKQPLRCKAGQRPLARPRLAPPAPAASRSAAGHLAGALQRCTGWQRPPAHSPTCEVGHAPSLEARMAPE